MCCQVRLVLVILLVLKLGLGTCLAQTSPAVKSASLSPEQSLDGGELDDGEFSLAEKILTLFVPRGVKDTWRLKRYLRSERFKLIREKLGDLLAVNEIYRRALEVTDGDVTEALFISTLATMEHRKVEMRIPLLGISIYLPLTSEAESTFRTRVSQLPSHFYADSPRGEAGDRDKLQHFFGSAFLAYSSRSRGLANLVGDFVEWAEDELIIDGASDARDQRANLQGIEFGLALGDWPLALPTEFLQTHLVLAGSRTHW